MTLEQAFLEALAHHRAGSLIEAERLYRRILAVDSRHADSLHLLGVLAYQGGDHGGAERLITRAIAENAMVFHFHCNLGNALRAQGRAPEAAACYRRAVLLAPDEADGHDNLGVALQEDGDFAAALGCHRRARAVRPEQAESAHALGSALKDLGQLPQAAACQRLALILDPGHGEAHTTLGLIFADLGQLAAAAAACRRALAIDPYRGDVHNNLALCRHMQGRLAEASAGFRRALACQPMLAAAETNLLFAQLYRSGTGLAEMREGARRWSAHHADRVPATAHPQPAHPRVLQRIGVLSADFRQHAVGFLIIRAFEGLARAGYQLIGYSNGAIVDPLTQRFRAAAAVWHDVAGWSDRRLADRIGADAVDILIDLSGFSAGNRLTLLAGKPAPVQIGGWVGCPTTLGMRQIDYVIADPHQIPPASDRFYSEAVIRLPHCYIAFEPPAEAPPLTPLPATANGHVTFGSFNVLKKISPEALAAWGRILAELPDSRLLVKAQAFDCPATARHFLARCADYGIIEQRLTLVGGTTPAGHRAWMQEADIALDSFPYAGGQTTLEALWMGLPVIALPGETFASRHSFSYLTNIGLERLAAASIDGYVQTAVALAGQRDRLAELRAGMRARMIGSPLCDLEGFTRSLDQALRAVWRAQCAGLPPRAVAIAE